MVVQHHGVPGRSLAIDGVAKYGPAALAGAVFEREVAAALDQWLRSRPEKVHVFHDVGRLNTINAASGRQLNLGTSNVDHVVLTGGGWIMADAKRVAQGRLMIDDGQGVLVTPSGQRRRQPWLENARAYSRAGAISDLAGGKKGVMVWVLPDSVDYSSHPSMAHPPCLPKRRGAYGYILSISELAAGELETIPELTPPYRTPDPADMARLERCISPTTWLPPES